MGIDDLATKNCALLDKWGCRILTGKDALGGRWLLINTSGMRLNGGLLWMDLVDLKAIGPKSWKASSFQRNGIELAWVVETTHFWKDRLLVDSPFCLEFPRLFRIVTAKDSFVCQGWSDSLYAWDIKFRRNFTDAEFNDGVALLNKLQTFRRNNRDDVYVWCWKMIAPSQTNRSPPSSLWSN